MKLLLQLTLLGFVFSFYACSKDCEDKTLDVRPELKLFLPYINETTITFTNEVGEESTHTIVPDVTRRNIPNEDDDCVVTTVQPFILVENQDEEQIMQIWLNRSDQLLGESDDFWAIIYEDGNIAEAGAVTNIENLDLVTTSVNINGQTFNDVIEINLNSSSPNPAKVYMQLNAGLVGYAYNGSVWRIEN